MAKPPSSAIGIDIGRHAMKAVVLQRKSSGQLSLTHFATRELDAEPRTVDALAANLKALLHELGRGAKACGVAVSHPDALVRIIEQPVMPPETLREALRYSSQTLLNQDCKDLVLDCDVIPAPQRPQAPAPTDKPPTSRYVVLGLPRMHVSMIYEACQKVKLATTALIASPLATFNAFEFSNEETFNNQAFVLVDIGHGCSTVIVGAKRELILVRTLDYGGRNFVDELMCHGATGAAEIFAQLGSHEALTVENARLSLTELVRSVSSSIGFVEARREEIIPRVFVEGGLLKSPTISQILTQELQLPCETWDPFAKCEINVDASRRALLAAELPTLGAAFGVAAGILKA